MFFIARLTAGSATRRVRLCRLSVRWLKLTVDQEVGGSSSTQLYQDLAPQADANGNELPGGWRVVPELAAGGLWSSAMDLARLSLELERAYRGESGALLASATARAMMTQQNGGPFGLGAAVAGNGASRVLMKRGQNIGYQSYMLLFPETGTRHCGADRVGQWHDFGDGADPPRRRSLPVAAARAPARLTENSAKPRA